MVTWRNAVATEWKTSWVSRSANRSADLDPRAPRVYLFWIGFFGGSKMSYINLQRKNDTDLCLIDLPAKRLELEEEPTHELIFTSRNLGCNLRICTPKTPRKKKKKNIRLLDGQLLCRTYALQILGRGKHPNNFHWSKSFPPEKVFHLPGPHFVHWGCLNHHRWRKWSATPTMVWIAKVGDGNTPKETALPDVQKDS